MVEIQPSVDLIRSMSTKDIIQTFGGWIEGHVTFENGEHGNGYVDNLRFLRHPQVMTEMGCRLAQQFSDSKDEIDVVVGPSIIGAIIAYSVADNIEVPFSTTYHQYGTGEMTFHRGFIPSKGSRCLFVDDFVFSGTCLRENVYFMNECGLFVVGASVIGIRQPVDVDVPIKSLIKTDFIKTSAAECHLCQNNVPITHYGIRE